MGLPQVGLPPDSACASRAETLNKTIAWPPTLATAINLLLHTPCYTRISSRSLLFNQSVHQVQENQFISPHLPSGR